MHVRWAVHGKPSAGGGSMFVGWAVHGKWRLPSYVYNSEYRAVNGGRWMVDSEWWTVNGRRSIVDGQGWIVSGG
eukprot:356999-Chlamydomonas_euryale.AAC.5